MTQRSFLMVLVPGLAACISLGCVQALKPVSAGAYVFWGVWLALPHVAIGVALYRAGRGARLAAPWPWGALLVSLAGLAFLADALFWHPDAQGGIAVLMTPLLQAGLAVVLLAVLWLVRQLRRG